MAYQVKQRIFSGTVCEQEVYFASTNRNRTAKDEVPRLRFQNEEERKRHREGISRRRFVQIVNANFSPSSIYSTLTFDQSNEIHTFQEARIIRERFFRRLKYVNPDAVLCIVMGRGKTTNRIHLHMISEGITEQQIRAAWWYGAVVECDHLREHNYYNKIDYGTDYTGLANYLWRHWTPEQGGHRYKITRNAKKPIKERPTEPIRAFSLERPPVAPKGYKYVEGFRTEYGYYHFKYVKAPPRDTRQGSRGDLLKTPCKYVNFKNEEGHEGRSIRMREQAQPSL